MANDENDAPAKGAETESGQQQVQVKVTFDSNKVDALYTNFCYVSMKADELILDLAIDPSPLGTQVQELRVDQRVIMNYYTAKRLATMLTGAVQRHEQMFGRLEVDVRKRLSSEQS